MEQKSNPTVKRWLLVVSILLLVLAVVMVVRVLMKNASHAATLAALDAEITELTRERNAIDTCEDVTVEIVRQRLYSANEAGNKLAALQTAYGKAEQEEEFVALSQKADELFAEGALGRGVWLAAAKDYTWIFCEAQESIDRKIPCLLICYADKDDPNSMLAYTRITYDADEDAFLTADITQTSAYQRIEYSGVNPVTPDHDMPVTPSEELEGPKVDEDGNPLEFWPDETPEPTEIPEETAAPDAEATPVPTEAPDDTETVIRAEETPAPTEGPNDEVVISG